MADGRTPAIGRARGYADAGDYKHALRVLRDEYASNRTDAALLKEVAEVAAEIRRAVRRRPTLSLDCEGLLHQVDRDLRSLGEQLPSIGDDYLYDCPWDVLFSV